VRIGLDARMLSYSGIGTYLRGLLSGFLSFSGKENYVLFGKDKETQRYLRDGKSQAITWNADPYDPFSLWLTPVKGRGLDLFHCPHYNLPYGIKRPRVITVHDLIHLVCPDLLTDRKAHWYASWMLPSATRRATHILTVSDHSKQEILRHLKVPETKITVIYHGVEEVFHPLSKVEVETYRVAHRLPERFLLYVGLLKPHKNIVRLLQAFSALHLDGVSLLLVGKRGSRYRDLDVLLEKEAFHQNVIFLSSIPFEELPLLYNAAESLILPSLYEGFGLPALEAMACGTPVVCSQATSLPEVVGDAAVLVDPLSVKSLAEGMWKSLENSALRSELRCKGLERAKQFRWQGSAAKTLSVYREVAQR
jgi:glycosyltransferase involved in cell wall biosynthesis